MNSYRFWILIASVIWFVSGVVVGLTAAGVWKQDLPEPSPVEHYTARMISEFGMKPERAQLFRELMAEYQEEIEDVREQHMAQQASSMEPEMARLGSRYTELIRDRVLTQVQREQFDRLASELP